MALNTPTTTPSVKSEIEKKQEKVYRTIWRWHFYAGLLVTPVILWAAITGSLYIFVDELEPVLYRSLYFIEPVEGRRSLDELKELVSREYPEGHIDSFSLRFDDKSRSIRFDLHSESEGTRHVYVDPYRGQIIGDRLRNQSFFPIVRTLHRNMFLGVTGRVLMELATSWGIILLVTGVYLWWPRKGKWKSPGVWKIRFRSGFKILLRDLHAVSGIYLMPIALLILVTGLFFSFLWGGGFLTTMVVTGSGPDAYFNPPHSTILEESKPLTLEEIHTITQKHDPGRYPVSIGIPHDEEAGIHIGVGSAESPLKRAIYVLDQYSGAVLTRTDHSNSSLMVKFLTYAYPLHVGSIFGLTTKILALLTCVVLCVSAITGIMMWWRSRPSGGFGLPSRSSGYGLKLWPVLFLCFCGILMPIVGLSLLIVLIIDRLIIRLYTKRDLTAC